MDIKTVDAGDGSIAQYVELTSNLRVGPESSGANPRSCLLRQRRKGCHSDPCECRIRIPSGKLLGGAFPLDVAPSQAAVESVASQVGLTTIRQHMVSTIW